MPSYNHESYLPEAIESVLNQSFGDFEMIIVDDCSKDDSQSIIESYQTRDKRIRTVFHRENMGIAKTLNDGMDKAQGKFIAFIDSDDVWVRSKLEKQLDELEKNEDTILWSEGEIIDSMSRPTGNTFTRMHGASQIRKSGDIFEELLYGNFIFNASLIFKREIIGGIRFDSRVKYLNDYRFVVDLARKHKYAYMPEPLAKYRVHGRNTILSDERGWMQDTVLVEEYFLREYGSQIPKHLKAYLIYRIGKACSRLGEKTVAKRLFLEAINFNSTRSFLTVDNMLYMVAALTDEDSLIGRFLLTFCYTVGSLLARLARFKARVLMQGKPRVAEKG
jgi:glycosyltransferase involved in cell wall biosynthesis